MKRSECPNEFLRGYCDTALFTTDPNPPGGCDYVESGQAADMFERLPAHFLEAAQRDCAKFQEENAALLEQAGNEWQNGSDFWYTRNRHGVGFWDRDYPDEVADPLTEAAHAFGEDCNLDVSDLTEESEAQP